MNCRLVEVDGSAYASAYGLGPLAAKLCAHSQLDDDQMKDLLGDDALTTSKAECVKAACDRLLKAKDQNEKVFVGGDYDADGICATTIMKKTLDLLGITNGYYIPDRLKEGYGLSAHTVQLAKQKGYSLIITVDNGVKAHEAIQAAHDLGMEIIITDHHTIDEEVGADILVHPTLMEEQYKTLSGAGVALEISRNLIGNDEMLNSIACVAAIGDVMPLWHETRRIVKRGIHNLSQGIPASVCALFNGRGRVDETAIAFQIVPKLNAVGRMNDDSNVNTVVPFLLSENRAVIADYARQLNDVNRARQNISARMLTKAKTILQDDDFLLVYDPTFETGISGLVAGRLAHEYHKPALVMADHNDLITGSARSVEGFNIYDFFSQFDCLKAFGGHPMAAGLSIAKEDYDAFCHQLKDHMAASHFVYHEPIQDAIIVNSQDIEISAIQDQERLFPWPKQLKDPLFAIRNPQVVNVMHRPKVVRYHLANQMEGYDAISFDMNKEYPDAPQLLIGTIGLNEFRSHISAQMMLQEIK